MIEYFERVRAEMRERDDEEREDAVIDVMDCLTVLAPPT